MAGRRKMRLLVEPPAEKVWAATRCVMLLSDREWVPIDAIGDFLKMRQIDAANAHFNSGFAATRYAIKPTFMQPGLSWRDEDIAMALRECVDKNLIAVERRGKMNFFRAIDKSEHTIWSVHDKTTPHDDEWRGAYAAGR